MTEGFTRAALAYPARGLNRRRGLIPKQAMGGGAGRQGGLRWRMAEVINLRLARKSRQRADAAARAAENRARHGRSKGERARDETEAERLARRIEGARRERDDSGDD